MVILLSLSVLLVALYVGATIRHLHALPESISAMVYVLPRGGWQWLWTIWLWVVALLTCIPVIEALSPKGLEVFGFFTLFCLGFTGAMPLFLKEQNRWHNILGVAGGIFSQVCTLLICHYFLVMWILMVWLAIDSFIPAVDQDSDAASKPRWYDKKGVTISEAICYVSLIGAAFVHFLFNY